MNDNLKTSREGRALIKSFERFEPTSYRCPAGKWTLGYGHTRGVTQGQTCTRDQADRWLDQDISDAEMIIRKHVSVKLTQGQFDAMVSFVFNIGAGMRGVKDGLVTLRNGKPSSLLTYLNASRFESAAIEMLKWCHVGGVILNGLKRRRQAEKDLFMSKSK